MTAREQEGRNPKQAQHIVHIHLPCLWSTDSWPNCTAFLRCVPLQTDSTLCSQSTSPSVLPMVTETAFCKKQKKNRSIGWRKQSEKHRERLRFAAVLSSGLLRCPEVETAANSNLSLGFQKQKQKKKRKNYQKAKSWHSSTRPCVGNASGSKAFHAKAKKQG